MARFLSLPLFISFQRIKKFLNSVFFKLKLRLLRIRTFQMLFTVFFGKAFEFI